MSRGFENPRSVTGEVCLRDGMGLLGIFFCTLRVTLVHIKMDVYRCLDWLDMGQGPDGFGSRPGPESRY